MLGIRASAKKLRDMIDPAQHGRVSDSARSPSAAIITKAIYHRESAGDTTTLRQLHRIVELAQPEALQLINALQSEGVVDIHENVHDALESTVRLTESTRNQLAQTLKAETP